MSTTSKEALRTESAQHSRRLAQLRDEQLGRTDFNKISDHFGQGSGAGAYPGVKVSRTGVNAPGGGESLSVTVHGREFGQIRKASGGGWYAYSDGQALPGGTFKTKNEALSGLFADRAGRINASDAREARALESRSAPTVHPDVATPGGVGTHAVTNAYSRPRAEQTFDYNGTPLGIQSTHSGVTRDTEGDHMLEHGGTGMITNDGKSRFTVMQHAPVGSEGGFQRGEVGKREMEALYAKHRDSLATLVHHDNQTNKDGGFASSQASRALFGTGDSTNVRLRTTARENGNVHVSNYDNGRFMGTVHSDGTVTVGGTPEANDAKLARPSAPAAPAAPPTAPAALRSVPTGHPDVVTQTHVANTAAQSASQARANAQATGTPNYGELDANDRKVLSAAFGASGTKKNNAVRSYLEAARRRARGGEADPQGEARRLANLESNGVDVAELNRVINEYLGKG